jgi:hypothetical protein
MSAAMIAHVFAASKSPPSARLVLLAIAYHTNHATGLAHPSERRLMMETGLSRRHLQRLLHELETCGELRIARSRGRGHANVYRITLKGVMVTPFLGEKRRHLVHEKGVMVTPQPNTRRTTAVRAHAELSTGCIGRHADGRLRWCDHCRYSHA